MKPSLKLKKLIIPVLLNVMAFTYEAFSQSPSVRNPSQTSTVIASNK